MSQENIRVELDRSSSEANVEPEDRVHAQLDQLRAAGEVC
jgi:hypothetical protein